MGNDYSHICEVVRIDSNSEKIENELIQNFQDRIQLKRGLCEIKAQNQLVELLKTKDATLGEKIKNTNSEIDSEQKSIDGLTLVCTDLENDLKTKLSKFNSL